MIYRLFNEHFGGCSGCFLPTARCPWANEGQVESGPPPQDTSDADRAGKEMARAGGGRPGGEGLAGALACGSAGRRQLRAPAQPELSLGFLRSRSEAPSPQLGPAREPARAWGARPPSRPGRLFPPAAAVTALRRLQAARCGGPTSGGRSLFPAARGRPGASVHHRCLFPTEVLLLSSRGDGGPLIR